MFAPTLLDLVYFDLSHVYATEGDFTIGASLDDGDATSPTTTATAARIVNPPKVSLATDSPVVHPEGDTGTTQFVFHVTLNKTSTSPVGVEWDVVDSNAGASGARAPDDFAVAEGSISFAPGETSKTITIEVEGDSIAEASELFELVLSNPTGAALGTDRAIGIVLNDDFAACTAAPFTDIPTNHPSCGEVARLKELGTTNGYADGSYRPGRGVTRMAAAVFLAALAGVDPEPCATQPFTDVAIDHPLCAHIQWLKDNGITRGYADGSYRPSAATTRLAGAAFLQRAIYDGAPASCTAAPFSDVPAAHVFCPEIQWSKAFGIVTGFNDGSFRPAVGLSRLAFAVMLVRAWEVASALDD